MPDLTTEKFSVLKEIDRSDITFEETVVHATQNLNTGSKGIQSISYVSGSINDNYWQSLHNLFYLSGSPVWASSSNYQYEQFASSFFSLGLSFNAFLVSFFITPVLIGILSNFIFFMFSLFFYY